MRKSVLPFVLAAAAATVGACVASTDGGSDLDDSTLTIVNDSSYIITEVHLAEVGSRSWGRNLVPEELYPGEELLVVDIDCGTYDVMVTDETGLDCILGNLDLCFDDDAWVIDDFTLDTCAFAY